ncbi:MAG TPA: TonB-dependent receptor plug domain-containing protein, partial [Patescibacteria group bacterium]|nr:TonB-dependent receptor plug domain-containing protein [Patescibacteria group bacterium]
MTPTQHQGRSLPDSRFISRVLFVLLMLPMLLMALPAGQLRAEGTAQPDDGAAAKPAADPNKPLPAPPTTITVEGSLPYIPTSNTIATRLPVPLRLTPANVGTVNDLLLREQHALVLGDALTNVSGVNVQTVSDVVDYFVIRGFDSLSSGLVLTDGAPEPEVTFYQMYNVDRVEVFKGPAGFLYGSNPLAGVVNIVRRQPVPGTFGSVGASIGSFATYDSKVDYNTSTQDGKYAFRINSAWRQSDFYRDDKDNRNSAVNPAFTWRLGDRSSLNINLEYVDSRYAPDSGLPLVGNRIADVPRTRSYQSPFDDSVQNIGRAQIDFETKLSDAWLLRNKTYYRDLDWKSNGTLFNGVFPSMTTGRLEVLRLLTLLDDTQRFAGDQLEGVLTASTGSVGHKLLIGAEAARFGD